MPEVPDVNILSKIDLVNGKADKRKLQRFLDPDTSRLDDDPVEGEKRRWQRISGDAQTLMRGASFKRLNKSVVANK